MYVCMYVRRVSEAAKQVHEAGGSGRTSVEDSDHAAVVA